MTTRFTTIGGGVDMAALPGATKVERAARALCLMAGDDPDRPVADDIERNDARQWTVYEEGARAALIAAEQKEVE